MEYAAGAPASGLPEALAGSLIVSPQYCLNTQLTLVLTEQIGQVRKDDFQIADEHGRPHFVLKAAMVSAHDRRNLLDATTGLPVLSLEKKMISLHGTWVIERPDGTKLATCKPSLSPISSSISVYINDGDSKVDYTVKGNLTAKKFTIVHHRDDGKGDVVVATIKKEGKFSSVMAYVRSKIVDSERYYAVVEPGTDLAFVSALATLVDEIYHDEAPKKPAQPY